MDELEEQSFFFDAPEFLNGIDSATLAFGGPILVLVIFIIINKSKLSRGNLMLSLLLLYVFSVLTGAALYDVGDRPSAFIAAFWAPLIYCSIATVLIWINQKTQKKRNFRLRPSD